MVNEIISDLIPDVTYDPPKSEVKRQKFIRCVLTGNSSPKVHMSTLLQIWFVSCTSICCNNYKQALSERNIAGTKNVEENRDE